MKTKICTLAFCSALLGFGSAEATTLTSATSMDNGFIAYISTNNSQQGTQFGIGNDWTTTFTSSTTLNAGIDYYLHIYGYDQGGVAGFLGKFTLSGTDHVFSNNSNTLLTNATDWKSNSTGWSSAYNAVSTWGLNSVSPWGTRPNIPNTANWIWAGNNDTVNVAYFSTKISATHPVPLPATVWLFTIGLLGVMGNAYKSGRLNKIRPNYNIA